MISGETLKQLLRDWPAPDGAPALFKSRLRERLLTAPRYQRSWRLAWRSPAFMLPAALSVGLLALISWFVIQPELPRTIHEALFSLPRHALLASGPGTMEPAPARAAVKVRWRPETDPSIEQALVQELYRNIYQRPTPGVAPIYTNRLFNVSRYQVDHDKQAFVYTPVVAQNIDESF